MSGSKKTIKLFQPNLTDKARKAVNRVLDSDEWYSGNSSQVRLFEIKLRDYLGCREVVAVNSGTAALHLATSLFEEGRVNVPSLSFVSTAMAPKMAGHNVRLCDVDPINLGMMVPKDLVTNDIMVPVHFGGMPCEITGAENIVEDCAHAMGSQINTKNIKCFSFHATKNLNMPNGGAIALYDMKHVDKLRARRWCGLRQFPNGVRDCFEDGYNYVMNNISAAMGIEQLKTLDRDNDRRLEIAIEYEMRLNEFKFVKMPISTKCSYHLYWVLVENRDEFRAKMAKEGIETGIHYPPIHKLFKFYNRPLNITDRVSKQIVTLPIHPRLTNGDLDRVIKSANSSV